MTCRSPARHHDQSSVWREREGRERSLHLIGFAHVDRSDFYSEQRRDGLYGGKHAGAGTLACVSKAPRPRAARHNLLENPQPFPADTEFISHEASDVAAWA